jgi:5-formyltetrahydrofolate cyclo-ligase
MMQKKELRDKFLEKRLALSSSEIETRSNKIIKKLTDYVNWQEISTINTYQTIKNNNEININGLLDFVRQNYPNIQIDIVESKVSSTQNVPVGKNYDLVIVPLLGFDRNGNRLGYGGGYYDKFLTKNNCKQAVGLAYAFQEVEELPVEEHDQKLDLIVTEEEIINL